MLYRHADVLAAFRDPGLAISAVPVDEASHTYVLRSAIAQSLTPERLAAWGRALDGLPIEIQAGCDLVTQVAEPWCHAAARLLVELPLLNGVDPLLSLARDVFAAGADPLNPTCKIRGDAAGAELASMLPAALGVVTAQAFVAVSQTLTAFLSGAWLVLLENPPQLQLLLEEKVAVRPALEELLRFAGPSQIQFRYETATGARIALAIGEANRDPKAFGDDADRLRLERRNAANHLALGSGPHACVGAAVVRLAASVAMRGFLSQAHGRSFLVKETVWPQNRAALAITGPQSICIA